MSERIENWEEQTFPLVGAAKELRAANEAYGKMVAIGIRSFHDYERAWRDFLHCVERAWNKTCAEARGRKNWQRIESECEKLRKTDPLLRYLIHARNVSEHTINPLIKEWDANLKVTPIGNKVRIEWDEWDRSLLPVTDRGTLFNPPKEPLIYYPSPSGRGVGVRETAPTSATLFPHPDPLPEGEGIIQSFPKGHLGKPWSHYRSKGASEPRTAAELAMRFYVGMLNRVSAEVYPGGRA